MVRGLPGRARSNTRSYLNADTVRSPRFRRLRFVSLAGGGQLPRLEDPGELRHHVRTFVVECAAGARPDAGVAAGGHAYRAHMTARTLAFGLAAGRIGLGVAFILAPGKVGAAWTGRDGRRAGAQVLGVGFGARDLALGLGTVAALSQ